MLILVLLLSGPRSLLDLQNIAGEPCSVTLLDDLRQHGIELPCREVMIIGADGYLDTCMVCMLTMADALSVSRWIKKLGGEHA
jgi:hypothetical protein